MQVGNMQAPRFGALKIDQEGLVKAAGQMHADPWIVQEVIQAAATFKPLIDQWDAKGLDVVIGPTDESCYVPSMPFDPLIGFKIVNRETGVSGAKTASLFKQDKRGPASKSEWSDPVQAFVRLIAEYQKSQDHTIKGAQDLLGSFQQLLKYWKP